MLKSSRLIKYSFDEVNYILDVQQIGERIIVDIPVNVINKKVFVFSQTVYTVVGGLINRKY